MRVPPRFRGHFLLIFFTLSFYNILMSILNRDTDQKEQAPPDSATMHSSSSSPSSMSRRAIFCANVIPLVLRSVDLNDMMHR
jgi:hypothetical protein